MTHARNWCELTAPRLVPTFTSILGVADGFARPRVRTNGMERRGFRVGVGCCVLGLAVASGCVKAPPESAQRLAETKKAEIELEIQLSQLEDRLLGAQAAVHMWQEIGRRHEQVSVVACENASHIRTKSSAPATVTLRPRNSRSPAPAWAARSLPTEDSPGNRSFSHLVAIRC